MKFRRIVFWLHLCAGVVAGLVILVMSATGVALAFEKESVAWVVRDLRRISSPVNASAVSLPLEDLLVKVREKQTRPSPSGVMVYADPSKAVLVSYGRTNSFYANPYTGAVLRREGFADFHLGRQVRTWTRFPHTGEALGWAGQFVAGLASARRDRAGMDWSWPGLASVLRPQNEHGGIRIFRWVASSRKVIRQRFGHTAP